MYVTSTALMRGVFSMIPMILFIVMVGMTADAVTAALSSVVRSLPCSPLRNASLYSFESCSNMAFLFLSSFSGVRVLSGSIAPALISFASFLRSSMSSSSFLRASRSVISALSFSRSACSSDSRRVRISPRRALISSRFIFCSFRELLNLVEHCPDGLFSLSSQKSLRFKLRDLSVAQAPRRDLRAVVGGH